MDEADGLFVLFKHVSINFQTGDFSPNPPYNCIAFEIGTSSLVHPELDCPIRGGGSGVSRHRVVLNFIFEVFFVEHLAGNPKVILKDAKVASVPSDRFAGLNPTSNSWRQLTGFATVYQQGVFLKQGHHIILFELPLSH